MLNQDGEPAKDVKLSGVFWALDFDNFVIIFWFVQQQHFPVARFALIYDDDRNDFVISPSVVDFIPNDC